MELITHGTKIIQITVEVCNNYGDLKTFGDPKINCESLASILASVSSFFQRNFSNSVGDMIVKFPSLIRNDLTSK